MSDSLRINQANSVELAKHSHQVKAMRSPRIAIQQGAELQQLAYRLAVSIANEADPEQLEQARMRAQSITGLLRSWTDVRQQVRVEQGKPSPGSLKPESKPKSKPRRAINLPANCGHEPTTSSVPLDPQFPPTPQE